MAKRRYNWMWRRLTESAPTQQRRRPRPVELRGDPTLRTVREHAPHQTTPAIDRFVALTERRLVDDEYCVIWKGGETFRVDDFTVTTPARFYWETMLGEKLRDDEKLYRACRTVGCIKHKEKR